jgi:putative chitinase
LNLTRAQFAAIFPGLSELQRADYLSPLNAALAEFEISTPFRSSAFLAQVGHESGGLVFWKELWGPTPEQIRYEPPSAKATELGNTDPGDGYRYRGRSPSQITGKGNYDACGRALGVDLVSEPEKLEQPEYGFRASGWFWDTRQLNDFADRDTFDSFRFTTRRINGAATMGAPSHHARRVERWLQARKVLGLQPPLGRPVAA